MRSANGQQENARTLGAALGIEEDAAIPLLQSKLQVTWQPGDRNGELLGREAWGMLSRTFAHVGQSDIPEPAATVELLVNNAAPLISDSKKVRCRIDRDGLCLTEGPVSGRGIPGEVHPILCLIGSCYAAARASQGVFGEAMPQFNGEPVFLQFEGFPDAIRDGLREPLDVRRVHLAGAGAVGNGFLYGLRHLRPRGELVIIDPKSVTDGILNRCMWFTDADIGALKAERLAQLAQPHFPALKLQSHVGTVAEYRRQDSEEISRLIVSVDSRRARRALQTELPREVFDASTTGIDEVVLHINRQPSEGACLACIYKRVSAEVTHEQHVAELLNVSLVEIREGFVSDRTAARILARYHQLTKSEILGMAYDSLFKSLCATGQLRVAEDRHVLAPFAFVSMLAGVWLALEFASHCSGTSRGVSFNYWRISPWASPNMDLRQFRPRLADCELCSREEYRSLSEELWGEAAAHLVQMA